MQPLAFFTFAVILLVGGLITGVTVGVVTDAVTSPTESPIPSSPTPSPTQSPTTSPTASPTPLSCWQFPTEEELPIVLDESFLDTNGSVYNASSGSAPWYFGIPDVEFSAPGIPYCDSIQSSLEYPYVQIPVLTTGESTTYYFCATSFHLGAHGILNDQLLLSANNDVSIMGSGTPAIIVPFCVHFLYAGTVLDIKFLQHVGNGNGIGTIAFLSTIRPPEEGWTLYDPLRLGIVPENATAVFPT